jgi:acetoin utilization deacetylase AcuC-like enzyme
MAGKVGVVRGDIFLRHDTGWGHPESSERLASIYGMLDESGLSKELEAVKLRRASKEEICLIHSEEHYDTIENTAGKSQTYLDGDTPTSPESFEAALYAAGSTIGLCDNILSGKLKSGFALVRPPGHHSERDHAMGFCLFNNIAIAAAWALENKGLKKILIVDFDVHHGNGTQKAFYDTDQVLYVSTHRYPFYPGTGYFNEVGMGKGEGFNVNVPLPGGMGDNEFDAIYTRVLAPIAREYKPEMIMVSAGFDAYHLDPLGGMALTEHGFGRLATIFMDLAEELCEGRLVFALEGGYSIEGIARCVQETFTLMLGKKPLTGKMGKPVEGFERILNEVFKYQKRYWKGLEL